MFRSERGFVRLRVSPRALSLRRKTVLLLRTHKRFDANRTLRVQHSVIGTAVSSGKRRRKTHLSAACVLWMARVHAWFVRTIKRRRPERESASKLCACYMPSRERRLWHATATPTRRRQRTRERVSKVPAPPPLSLSFSDYIELSLPKTPTNSLPFLSFASWATVPFDIRAHKTVSLTKRARACLARIVVCHACVMSGVRAFIIHTGFVWARVAVLTVRRCDAMRGASVPGIGGIKSSVKVTRYAKLARMSLKRTRRRRRQCRRILYTIMYAWQHNVKSEMDGRKGRRARGSNANLVRPFFFSSVFCIL